MILVSTTFWFFLAQMPGDSTWMKAGRFDTKMECETIRQNWNEKHPNFRTQSCQQEWS